MTVDLFQILDLELVGGNRIVSRAALCPESEILKAHFPTYPIVPGVCLVDLVLKVLEKHLGYRPEIAKAKDLRFLSKVTPDTCDTLTVNISLGDSVIAVLANSETAVAKMTFTLR